MRNKLTIKTIQAAKSGMHSDGNGLYLVVAHSNSRSWIYRYQLDGKRREMGLGSYPTVSLIEARLKAMQQSSILKGDGVDPLKLKQQVKVAAVSEAKAVAARAVRFSNVAKEYISSHRSSWRNAKHGDQWTNTLNTYAYPVLDEKPICDIDRELVLRVLLPIWTTKTETATRVRSRIELVLSYAKVKGLRSGENPATWRGNLDAVLPNPRKVTPHRKYPSLPFKLMPRFMSALRARAGISAKALELAILCAARSNEVRRARWPEFDLIEKVWRIPAVRMKAQREHRVPLSDAAVNLLKSIPRVSGNEIVFLSIRKQTYLSDMALSELVREMNQVAVGEKPLWVDEDERPVVPHGFRASFRTWADDETHYPHDMKELAIAHAIEDKSEAAYRRSDMFEKRRQLMSDWADWCEPSNDYAIRLVA